MSTTPAIPTGPHLTDEQVAELRDLGARIQGLREACDISVEELAGELGISVETYCAYEETGQDVPISVIYHLAQRTGVDFTDIITGKTAKLDSLQVVHAGAGRTIERYEGYHYQDLAWRFNGKIMQPLLVTLDPSDEPAPIMTHAGQEFNLVTKGAISLTFDGKEIILQTGDSAYFDSMHPHGQKCASSVPATFVTIIAE